MNRRQTIGSVMTAAAMVSAHAAAQECGEYQVTAIVQAAECPPFGYPPTSPRDINEAGWMVGTIQSCVIGPDVAMLWTPEDGLMVIPTPPGTSYSAAAAISGSLIVGAYDNPDLELGRTGFLYDYEAGRFTSLGTLPGGNWSQALDVNPSGQITGFWGSNVIGFWNAFIWQNGEMTDLGPSIGGVDNQAFGINESGAITGWWKEDGGEQIAFLWEDGDVTSLGPVPDGFTSDGRAINALKQIAVEGVVDLGKDNGKVVHGALWSDGTMTDLGTLPGTLFTRPQDIDNQSRIVGYCHNSGLTNKAAFIWHEGEMIALNDVISPSENLNLRRAMGINQAGQITCSALDQFNDNVTVLLTPITGPPGDLNGDCQITAADLLILLASWGPCKGCPGDLDDDGSVGASDLLILLSNWG